MKYGIAIALAGMLAFSGCANLNKIIASAESVKITETQVVVAGNTFDAIEATATSYLALKRCLSGQTFLKNTCRDSAATKPLIAAIHSGRTARDALEAFYKAHPDGLGAKGLYDAFNSATDVIRATLSNYGASA